MKIWKASLVLYTEYSGKVAHKNTESSSNILNKFYFIEQEHDYKINKYNPDKEWCLSEGWTYQRIPRNMEIEEVHDNIQVTQGFDRELTAEELVELEKKMKLFLIEYLKNKKEQLVKIYDKKIMSLEEK